MAHPLLSERVERPLQTTPLALLMGLPDDGMVRVQGLGPGGEMQIDLPGALSFLPFLDASTRARMRQVFFGPGIPLKIAPAPSARPLVNNIADPDLCSLSLAMLADVVAKLGAPAFNMPRAIIESTRDRVSAKLSAIPGLVVPRTVRLRLSEQTGFRSALDDCGIEYPLIVRIAGTHGGLTTVRIDRPQDATRALAARPWGGRELYISQYVDYADEDGRYRKQRIAIVGSKAFLRHHIVADEWHVHSQARNVAGLQEETELLSTFASARLPGLQPILEQIGDAMDLDYFGIDCSMRPDGSILIFEANAAMNFLINSAPSPNVWDAPIHTIRAALQDLLARPERWRASRRRAS